MLSRPKSWRASAATITTTLLLSCVALICLTVLLLSWPAGHTDADVNRAHLPLVMRPAPDVAPGPGTATPTGTPATAIPETVTPTPALTQTSASPTSTLTPTGTFYPATKTATPDPAGTPIGTPVSFYMKQYTCDPQAVGIPVGGDTGIISYNPNSTGAVIVSTLISERPFQIRRHVTFTVSGSAVASFQAIFPAGGWDEYKTGCLNGAAFEITGFAVGSYSPEWGGEAASISVFPATSYCPVGVAPRAGSVRIEVSCTQPE
jgi:hypothetical protein